MTIYKNLKNNSKYFLSKFIRLLGPNFFWMLIKILNNALFKKNSDLYYTFQMTGNTGIFGTFVSILNIIRILEIYKVPIYIKSDQHFYVLDLKSKKKYANIWNLYFQQPYRLDKLIKKKISLTQYNGKSKFLRFLSEVSIQVDDYSLEGIKLLSKISSKFIKLNSKVRMYVNKKISEIIKPKDIVLGIYIRDAYTVLRPKNHWVQPDMVTLKKDIKKLFVNYKINKILVVCENHQIIKDLGDEFGDIVVSINRPRINDQRYKNKFSYAPSKKLPSNIQVKRNFKKKIIDYSDFGRINEIEERTKEYISEIYALARCKHLLAGKSNGSAAAVILNNCRYETVKFYELGFY
jgi:hypothetical protein